MSVAFFFLSDSHFPAWLLSLTHRKVTIDQALFWGLIPGYSSELTDRNSCPKGAYIPVGASLRRNEATLMVNNRVQNAVLGYNLKSDRMILVPFQGKPFKITIIQVFVPITDGEEAEVDQLYEDLQNLLEPTPKMISFSSQGIGMQK